MAGSFSKFEESEQSEPIPSSEIRPMCFSHALHLAISDTVLIKKMSCWNWDYEDEFYILCPLFNLEPEENL